MKLWLIAGESSGDTRAAELIRELCTRREGIHFLGYGGSKMKALAPAIHDWAGEAGVLGLWDVLKKYPWFKQRFEQMRMEIRAEEPDAVVFIDYPGFNLRMARALRAEHQRMKLLYYVSPQVWAWNRTRISKMAGWLDLMLCIFPFEKSLYEASGLQTECVGHPLVDQLASERSGDRRQEALLGLFPGSREREVRKIFPAMIRAAAMVRDAMPSVRVEASAASARLRDTMSTEAALCGVECEIRVGESHSLMRRATAGLVASGTATLEAAFFGMPYALVYRVAWLTYLVGRFVIQVPYLGIVNILLGREAVQEFIQDEALPGEMAAEALRLLGSAEAREKCRRDLAEAVSLLGGPGAASRAAVAILREMEIPRRR